MARGRLAKRLSSREGKGKSGEEGREGKITGGE